MPRVIADTDALVAEGVIDADAAEIMIGQSRAILLRLAINMLLCFGIFAATGGLVVWLAAPILVAIVGLLFLGGGLMMLAKLGDDLSMLGNAAALIGAGMLIGGASIELTETYPDIAGPALTAGGALVALIATWRWSAGVALSSGFVVGAISVMGAAAHLIGAYFWLDQSGGGGAIVSVLSLYAFAIVAALGWWTDVRTLTALAIVPFAQALDTGSGYFGALYAFWSPESTLTILQMTLLIVALWWLTRNRPDRDQRHGRTLIIMAFVVANLCALVGSLFGDVVGENLWGPGRWRGQDQYTDFDAWRAAKDAFIASAWRISANAYSVFWALVLVALIFLSARAVNRALFNAAVTFAALHAYTQLFESFADEPLAYVIGGLAAIPLAWGVWKLNQTLLQKDPAP